MGLDGVSDNVHVDASLFCAAWRLEVFSHQMTALIIQTSRDLDISFGDQTRTTSKKDTKEIFNSPRTIVILCDLSAMK